MKQLSIEQKAKAYDEAIWKLRGMMPNWERLSYNGKTFLQDLIYIFPELKESEDEKIRKELKFKIGDTMRTLQEAKDGWTDGMPFVVSIDSEYYNCNSEKIAIKDQDEYEYPPMNRKHDICVSCDEQKPTDKVEPKFKVGDWVMLDRPVLIIKVEDMPYNTHQYWTSDGTWFGDATNAKLWNISDAKDGDVLATDDGNICVFDGTVEDGKYPFAYCGLTRRRFESYDRILPFTHDNVHPATKEQRDLLFQKMKEAGYVWDAEKKELKNIEESFVKASKFEKEEELELKKFAEEWDESLYRSDAIIAGAQWYKQRMKEILEAEYERGKNDTIAEMKKSAEDSCKNSDDITTEEKDMTEYKKGFECGKQRVLKYPEDFDLCKRTLTAWSEEEIEKAAQEWESKAIFNPFYMTMDGDKPTGVKQDITTHKESFKAGINWILKSLKDRYTWKPSDE